MGRDNDPDVARIAALEEVRDTVRREMVDMRDTIEKLARKIEEQNETLSKATGGLKVLLWLGGFVTAGGFLHFGAQYFGIIPPSAVGHP